MKKVQLGIRISDEMYGRLATATDRALNPYAPTMTQIVERGVELALRELKNVPTGRRTK